MSLTQFEPCWAGALYFVQKVGGKCEEKLGKKPLAKKLQKP
jgi:hypothetical protein